MLGFKPVPVEVVKAVDPQVSLVDVTCANANFMKCYILLKTNTAHICIFISQLETVNKNLEAYYDAWDKFVKAWIVIKIKDPSCVYQWRLQVGFCGLHPSCNKLHFSIVYVLFVVKCNNCLLPQTCRQRLPWERQETLECPMMRLCPKPSIYNYILVSYKLSAEPRTDAFRGINFQVKDFVSRYLPAYNAYLPTLYAEGPKGSDPKHLIFVEIDEGRNPILGN